MTDDTAQAPAKGKTKLAVVAPLGTTEFRVPNDKGDDLVVTTDGTEVPSGSVSDLKELAAASGVLLAETE